jgi:hypothetical protein
MCGRIDHHALDHGGMIPIWDFDFRNARHAIDRNL